MIELDLETREAIAAVLARESPDPVRIPLLALLRCSRGVDETRIAEQLGCEPDQITDWLAHYRREGLLGLIPPDLRVEVARAISEGLPAEDAVLEGDDPRCCPIPGCWARTPEGLLLFAASEAATAVDSWNWEAITGWLADQGCTPERVDVWLGRLRCVSQAACRSRPRDPEA